MLDAIRQVAGLQSQLATDFAGRTDEVLALAPDALLVRRTYFGSSPA